MLNCVILRRLQNCALAFADWNSLDMQVKSFTDVISTPDLLAKRLAGFEVIVAMRERTRFDASALARLPRLKLLVTTGMRNSAIDMDPRSLVASPSAGHTAYPIQHPNLLGACCSRLLAISQPMSPPSAPGRNGRRESESVCLERPLGLSASARSVRGSPGTLKPSTCQSLLGAET